MAQFNRLLLAEARIADSNQETQSAFHPLAQRNAFHRRDVRPQSRRFACWNPTAETQPKLQPALKIVDHSRRISQARRKMWCRESYTSLEIIKNSAVFVAKKQCNKLRGARIPGDLPWRGVHESARRPTDRLSAPVSARSLLPKTSTQNPRLCRGKKHYPTPE